jgi:hypothetical protein
MLTMTAAEIAAAEAAAIAAAEAAAVHAAQVAAAEAAAQAAATAAAEQAAAQAATQAAANTATATATNAATNQSVLQAIGAGPAAPASAAQLGGYGAGAAGGIPTLGAGAGTGVAGGIPTLSTGAGTGANLGYETLAKEVSGIEQLVNAANYPLPSAVPTVPSVPNVVPPGAEFIPPSNFGPPAVNTPLTDAQYNFLHNSTAGGDLETVRSIIQNSEPVTSSLTGTAPVSSAPTNPLYQFQGPKIGLEAPPGTFSTPDPLFNITPSTTQGVIPRTSLESPLTPSGDPFYSVNSGSVNSMGHYRPLTDLTSTGVDATAVTPGAPETGGLKGLYNDFMNMPLKDKLMTGLGGSVAYDMLNKPKPKEEEKYKSTFKPGLYTGYTPVQPTPYRPQYAAGGVADLGGYSDGGRMLKGPGDGMSDDIPATIANKQPARLANEEFVIPADVVSHLGNGSSEAGAKQLYKMMDRIRKARTGTKKQGKQINPEKYLA